MNKFVQFDFRLSRRQGDVGDSCNIGSAHYRYVGAVNFSPSRPSRWLLLALLFGLLCAASARVLANNYVPTSFTDPFGRERKKRDRRHRGRVGKPAGFVSFGVQADRRFALDS